ncbi:hypothetical protein lerEdw1_017714 [Lerista edwardsae]|nr:hypothetical protein lerEdw1_017714 [Lerista edwardsae]
MDVDSQNPIFDVNMTADALDTPHITPAPSQCSTPPTTYPQSIPHAQPSIQRMVRLSSSDSIGADVTDILSDIAEEAAKLPSTSEDCPPTGTPVRDSSSSGHSQSALFDPDVFQSNNSENPYTDPADLIADATVSPNSDSSNQFFPDGVDFNPDLLNSQSESGFGEEYFDDSSQSGDADDFKGFAPQTISTLGVQVLGGDGGESKFKASSQADTVDFSIITAASKALGVSDVMEHHSGSQSPLLSTGDLGKEKSQKRVKEGNGSGSSLIGPGLDGKGGKRSRTPSSDGKSKEKVQKRRKVEPEGKSPSHSSSTRPFTPPASTGGSKSPGSSGRSQTPPRGSHSSHPQNHHSDSQGNSDCWQTFPWAVHKQWLSLFLEQQKSSQSFVIIVLFFFVLIILILFVFLIDLGQNKEQQVGWVFWIQDEQQPLHGPRRLWIRSVQKLHPISGQARVLPHHKTRPQQRLWRYQDQTSREAFIAYESFHE